MSKLREAAFDYRVEGLFPCHWSTSERLEGIPICFVARILKRLVFVFLGPIDAPPVAAFPESPDANLG
jgi:hypothetical protein